MKKVTFHIESLYDNKTVSLDDELSIGRTNQATVVLEDTGLSRKNTTFFRDGEQVFAVDEDSLNGTFVNGEKISGAPVRIFDGDEITLGNETRIRVKIAESQESKVESQPLPAVGAVEPPKTKNRKPKTKDQKPAAQNPKPNRPPMVLMIAIASIFVIVALGVVALLVAGNIDDGNKTAKPTPPPIKAVIPVRVIDPLGGEDPEDLDDIIAGWEMPEEELKVETVKDVVVKPEDATKDEAELTVTAAFLAQQKAKALERRDKETGIRPAGLDVPKELFGDGVIKQKVKLNQMINTPPPYQQPMDFSDLAAKRLKGDLLEMPMATDSFYLEVGGSASDGAFTAFSFQAGNTPIMQGSDKYNPLSQLAAKYGVSLDNAIDRKQIRMRLLRMFNPKAKPILQKLALAYYQEFKRPLRVTSLTRSMDYQILLNATNANSFKVKGAGSLPPHTSGCAFDLARKHMGVDEQNFVMKKLAEMERNRELDALIEYGTNACFHVFIYYDGTAPNM